MNMGIFRRKEGDAMEDYNSNYNPYEATAEELKAIAHPTRLQILHILIEKGP